jgi:hypothetical protein
LQIYKDIHILKCEGVNMKIGTKYIVLVLLVVLIFTVPTSAAENMKISPGDYISSDPKSDVEPLLPIITMIVSFALLVYGGSLVISPLISGTKINAAPIIGSNEVRKDGQKGILHVVAGLFLLCVGTMVIVLLWNGYGPGAW